MGILIICYLLAIITTIGQIYLRNNEFTISDVDQIGAIVLAVVPTVMAICLNVFSDSLYNKLAKNYDLYNSLIESSSTYDCSLIISVYDYNEQIQEGRRLQYNIWCGAFVPNIYDNLPLLELNVDGIN